MRRMSLVTALLLALATSAFGFESTFVFDPATGRMVEVVKGQAIIITQPGVTMTQATQLVSPLKMTVWGGVEDWNIYYLKLPAALDVEAALAKLRALPEVAIAQPDYVYHALFPPNDPLYPQQTLLSVIRAPQAWDITQGNGAIAIAVLDTGVDYNHEDLRDKILTWGTDTVDFVNNDSDPMDDESHGTGVAGIAAATTNNSLGVAGVGFNVRILPLKVLSAGGGGSTSWAISAINYANSRSEVKVLNMSFGGYGADPAERTAIDNAFNNGKLSIAGAGNDGADTEFYPAAFTNSVAVCATRTDPPNTDVKWSYSNYGNVSNPWVDICAPANEGMFTTRLGGGYTGFGGTSGATPVVAGVAALIYSVFPTFTAQQARNKLLSTADDIYALNQSSCGGPCGPPGIPQSLLGSGRVNAQRAVQGGGGGGDSTPPTVKITSPVNNSIVKGMVQINATALDNVGVERVDFLVDGVPVGSDTVPPYSATWNSDTVNETTHTISARAFDAGNNSAEDSVVVTVDRTPPAIVFTTPQSIGGNPPLLAGTVPVQFNVTDKSVVNRLDFFVDNVQRATLAPPFSYLLNTVSLSDGLHTLRGNAADAAGNIGTATLTVRSDNTRPKVEINSPKSGDLVSGIFTVDTTISDANKIGSAAFYVDGTLKGTTSNPASDNVTFNWDTTREIGKNHTLLLDAFDKAGNENSATVSVILINDLIPPQVAISLPPNNSKACGNIRVAATASDERGLQNVQLFDDTSPPPALIGALQTPPFSFIYSSMNPGQKTLRAQATDTSDNVGNALLNLNIVLPQHSPPAAYPPSGSLALSFTADESNVSTATLFFRALNSTDLFTGMNPTAVAPPTYLFQILVGSLPPSGLEYYLLVESSYYDCQTQRYTISSPYLPGDVNLDGKVDELDALEVAAGFGLTRSDAGYRPQLDPNHDGVIDDNDLAFIFAHFSP